MAQKFMIVALGLFAAASPSLAAGTGPTAMPAPSDSPDALYCLRIEAVTGTRLETVRCWTRAEWAEQGVDVDADWAEEGVSIIQPRSAVLS
jgi:hypothetical protein